MNDLIYYSPNGQDKIVLDILQRLKYGYYVEVGVTNDVYVPHTHTMKIHLDWDGVRILPGETNLFSVFDSQHIPAIIHYMLIDFNGCSYDLLSDYLAQEYAPIKTLCYRYMFTLSLENVPEEVKPDFKELLKKYNYVFLRSVGTSEIYIHQAMDILT